MGDATMRKFFSVPVDGMALPGCCDGILVVIDAARGCRPCESAPVSVLCVRVHGLSGQDGPRVRVPGTA